MVFGGWVQVVFGSDVFAIVPHVGYEYLSTQIVPLLYPKVDRLIKMSLRAEPDLYHFAPPAADSNAMESRSTNDCLC